jgi:hypothetical protein
MLREANADVVDAFSIEPGSRLDNAVRENLGSSDIVVVLLGRNSLWQMYELGFAASLGKPIAVIADPAFALPPVVHADFMIATPFDDDRMIRSFIGVVLRSLSGRANAVPAPVPATARVDPTSMRDLLARVRVLRAQKDVSGRVLEELVFSMLAATGLRFGANVAATADGARSEADAILHAPTIAPLIASPILIEVKAGRMSEKRVRDVYRQIGRQMETFGLRSALLIYLDPDELRLPLLHSPGPILAVDLEDLLAAMLDAPIERVLIELRNKAVHGP